MSLCIRAHRERLPHARHGTQLVVLDEEDKSPEAELGEDVLAIMQVFACRWNDKRRYRNPVVRDAGGQDPRVPDAGPEGQAGANGRGDQVHVQQDVRDDQGQGGSLRQRGPVAREGPAEEDMQCSKHLNNRTLPGGAGNT